MNEQIKASHFMCALIIYKNYDSFPSILPGELSINIL